MGASGKFEVRNTKAAKLTAAQVQDIRWSYKRDRISQGQLARDYNVSVITIGRIVRREVWQNLAAEITPEELRKAAERSFALQQDVETPGLDKLQALAEVNKRGDRLVDELLSENASVADRAKRFLGEG